MNTTLIGLEVKRYDGVIYTHMVNPRYVASIEPIWVDGPNSPNEFESESECLVALQNHVFLVVQASMSDTALKLQVPQ
jgi:hypothetical protein